MVNTTSSSLYLYTIIPSHLVFPLYFISSIYPLLWTVFKQKYTSLLPSLFSSTTALHATLLSLSTAVLPQLSLTYTVPASVACVSSIFITSSILLLKTSSTFGSATNISTANIATTAISSTNVNPFLFIQSSYLNYLIIHNTIINKY